MGTFSALNSPFKYPEIGAKGICTVPFCTANCSAAMRPRCADEALGFRTPAANLPGANCVTTKPPAMASSNKPDMYLKAIRTISRSRPLGSGFYSKKYACVLVGQNVQKAIRSFAYFANSLLKRAQQGLSPYLFPSRIENNPLELPGQRKSPLLQAADEQISFPLGKLVARIEGHT